MRFWMEIEMNNDAFDPYNFELSTLVTRVADDIRYERAADMVNKPQRIVDSNGNVVGSFMIEEGD